MRCVRIIPNCMLSCEGIFSRIQLNFLLSETISVFERRKSAGVWAQALLQAKMTAGPTAKLVVVLKLLGLRNDSKIRLRRFPALRIPFLCFFVRNRPRDDNVLSWQPVDRRSHLVLRSQLQ